MNCIQTRLLLIDVVRIVAIVLVLLEHFAGSGFYPGLFYPYTYISNMYTISYGTVGVWLFIFVSGFSLAYSSMGSKLSLREFYAKRVLRIYPAYWNAILLSAILNFGWFRAQTFGLLDIAKLLTGFQSLGATTSADFYGKVNGTFWFITLILSLYVLFPLLLFAIEKHPHISILSFLIVSVASRYLMINYTPFFRPQNWFLLCRLFNFSIGIYLVKVGAYLKKESKNILIVSFSSIVFFIYLINMPLILFLGQYPVLCVVSILVVSAMMYKFDESLRRSIRSAIVRFRERRSMGNKPSN